MRDKLIRLAKCTFQQNCIRGKPLIHQVCSIYNEEVRHRRGEKYTRGNVLIMGLWERHNGAIIDIIFGDPDYDSYKKEPMVSLIAWWVKGENYRHGKHFHKQWKKIFIRYLR